MSIYGNRFERNKKMPVSGLTLAMSLGIFVVLFFLFYKGVVSVSDTNLEKQKESLETALSRSITQCYAVEGTYPPNLDYIKEHYGLTYDENMFYIDYQPIGGNLMPDVTVLVRTGGKP